MIIIDKNKKKLKINNTLYYYYESSDGYLIYNNKCYKLLKNSIKNTKYKDIRKIKKDRVVFNYQEVEINEFIELINQQQEKSKEKKIEEQGNFDYLYKNLTIENSKKLIYYANVNDSELKKLNDIIIEENKKSYGMMNAGKAKIDNIINNFFEKFLLNIELYENININIENKKNKNKI